MGFSNQQNWRLWMGTQMFHAAHALEFLTIGIMRPEDLVACTRRFYMDPAIVTYWVKSSAEGLSPSEAALLDQVAPKPGSALVLGCAAGREAIALAQQGWQVVGIDNVPVLLEAAKAHAAHAEVRIEWHRHDMTQGIPADRSFDLICLLGATYNLIPTRAWRVRLLTACQQHLRPHGRCLIDFALGGPPSQRACWAHMWRKRLAWVTGGNRGCQLGDCLSNQMQFLHRFSAVTEIAEEAAAAGLRVECESTNGISEGQAVLKPVTTEPQQSRIHTTLQESVSWG